MAIVWLAVALLPGCKPAPEITSENFVGVWKSSKLDTPIYLYPNSEWEIRTDKGVVLQYGVWQYNGRMIWSYKVDGNVGHDENVVVASNRTEFTLKEADGSHTLFIRLRDLDGPPEPPAR